MTDSKPISILEAAPPTENGNNHAKTPKAVIAAVAAVLLIAAVVSYFSLLRNDFPGYTYVGDSPQHDRIYINLGSMQFVGGLLHAKVLFKPHATKNYDYQIADLATNCSGKDELLGATEFKANGAPMQSIYKPTSTEFSAAAEMVSRFACARSEDLQSISEGFDALKAIEMLYGPVDKGAQTAIWLNPPEPPVEFTSLDAAALARFPNAHPFQTFDRNEKYTVHLVSTLDAKEGDVKKKFLIAAAYPAGEESCHNCRTIIGMAVFKLEGSKWHLEAFGPFAAWGPELSDQGTKLIQIGRDRSAVQLTTEHSAQSEEDEGIQIIAAVGNWIGQVFEYGTFSSWNGCDMFPKASCWSNRTEIRFVPGRNPEYFDIQAVTTGTKSKEQSFEAISANESRTFTLVGRSYR